MDEGEGRKGSKRKRRMIKKGKERRDERTTPQGREETKMCERRQKERERNGKESKEDRGRKRRVRDEESNSKGLA